MLTMLKNKRGEGKLVGEKASQSEPQQRRTRFPHSPPSSSPPKEEEETLGMPLVN